MGAPQGRTAASMHERLQELAKLPESSPRRRALTAASRFKSTWVELGEALTAVQRTGDFGAWGYKSFESYCKSELHLRQETVLKLTRSWAFLQQHAPDRARAQDAATPAPALDVVHLLSQAKERTQVSQAALKTMSDELLRVDAPVTRADALKKLRAEDPQAFRPKGQTAPKPKADMQELELKKALLLAERLYALLGAQGGALSHEAHVKLEAVVQQLRQAYGHMRPQTAAVNDSNLSQHGQMH